MSTKLIGSYSKTRKPPDQEQKMQHFVDYWDPIITPSNPFPRQDENMPHIGDHPCCKPRETLENTKEELAELLNWVQQHWHTACKEGYCLVKRKSPGQEEARVLCRFDYPKTVRAEARLALIARTEFNLSLEATISESN